MTLAAAQIQNSNVELIYIRLGSLEEWHLYIAFSEYNNGDLTGLKNYYSPELVTGVFHVDVTRDTDGTFSVYANSSSNPVIKVFNNLSLYVNVKFLESFMYTSLEI